MLVKLFKSNQIQVLFFLILLILILRIDLFFTPSIIYTNNEFAPLYNLLYRLIQQYKFLVLTLNIVILTLQVLFLNYIISDNNIAAKNSYLIGFVYLLLLSISPSIAILNPALIANIFLLFSIASIFKIYGQENYQILLFNASFLISIASLFYLPSITFAVFLYLSLIVYRELSLRSFFIIFIGILVPYLYLFTYYLWTDKLYFVLKMLLSLINFKEISINLTNYGIFLSLILGVITLIAVLSYWVKVTEKLVKIRKYFFILLWFFISGFLGFILTKGSIKIHFCILAIPLAVFIANYLYLLKKNWIANTLIFIILGIIIYSKFR